MKKEKIIIGSRSSKLALIYAQNVKNKIIEISDFQEDQILIKGIVTKGDQVKDKRISEVGGKGLFSKNIEKELLNNSIDIAVHALKDMPAIETKGLVSNFFKRKVGFIVAGSKINKLESASSSFDILVSTFFKLGLSTLTRSPFCIPFFK